MEAGDMVRHRHRPEWVALVLSTSVVTEDHDVNPYENTVELMWVGNPGIHVYAMSLLEVVDESR